MEAANIAHAFGLQVPDEYRGFQTALFQSILTVSNINRIGVDILHVGVNMAG